MVKSDHGEDHTPWAIWEHHWGILNHFWKTCKNSEIGTWTGGRKYSGESCSISQPPKTRDEMRVSPISRNQGMSQLIQSTYGLEYYVVHKVSAGYEHWCNSWSTEPQFELCARTSKSLSLGGVLMAIISHFDRQLLGNNMSFTPCSIHIFTNF